MGKQISEILVYASKLEKLAKDVKSRRIRSESELWEIMLSSAKEMRAQSESQNILYCAFVDYVGDVAKSHGNKPSREDLERVVDNWYYKERVKRNKGPA
jgi:hypothetical protein